eukprot:768112-Hanusia_phi.AAC.1
MSKLFGRSRHGSWRQQRAALGRAGRGHWEGIKAYFNCTLSCSFCGVRGGFGASSRRLRSCDTTSRASDDAYLKHEQETLQHQRQSSPSRASCDDPDLSFKFTGLSFLGAKHPSTSHSRRRGSDTFIQFWGTLGCSRLRRSCSDLPDAIQVRCFDWQRYEDPTLRSCCTTDPSRTTCAGMGYRKGWSLATTGTPSAGTAARPAARELIASCCHFNLSPNDLFARKFEDEVAPGATCATFTIKNP